jgi:glycosyltransferase involved in cell wall biosynthesis
MHGVSIPLDHLGFSMNVLVLQKIPRISPQQARPETERGRPKVALVLTREITDDSGFGRVKTLREIRNALRAGFDVTELHLPSVIETRRLSDLVTAGARLLLELLAGRPVPLQNILYSGASQIETLTASLAAEHFDAVYLDSVRCQLLMRKIRRRLPGMRLIVDLDDLMSRRMEQLARRGVTLSLGFLRHRFPKPLQWLAQGPLSGVIARYEAAALNTAELEIARSVQAVVLVSSAERDILRHKLTPETREIVHSIPPPAQTCRNVPALAGPFRFTFIGSDRLAQNRLAIDFLLRLWGELRPSACLHIYGRQERPPVQVAGVIWHGYVDDVSVAYTSGSVLLLPCLLPGGIKTKVIEAWSFGCPVLGSPLAFEGVEAPEYPLALPEAQWTQYLLHPEQYCSVWVSAAQLGNAFVRSTLSAERYGKQWRRIVVPGEPESRTPAATHPTRIPAAGVAIDDIPR